MSYDLYFFRKADGYSLEEINAELRRMQDEDEEEYADEGEDDDEDSIIPAKFFNDCYEHEQFARILLKPYLRSDPSLGEWYFQEDKNKEQGLKALQAYLASDSLELPDELDGMNEMFFEMAMDGGMMPLMCSYSGDVVEFARTIAKMLSEPELAERGIIVFDPQAGLVMDKDTAEQALLASAESAAEGFQDLLDSLQGEDEQE